VKCAFSRCFGLVARIPAANACSLAEAEKAAHQKNWRPAFAGRQNQTQGVEARYTIGATHSSRCTVGLFAFIVITKTVGQPKPGLIEFRVVRMA
jgi:hypothetical protein